MVRTALICLSLAWGAVAQPLIVVAVDGLRHDFIEVHGMKHLAELRQQGASVERMRPSFPSTTFPNFHSMATGLEPSRHNLVAMSFYDRKLGRRFWYQTDSSDGFWYGGVPFWEVAERAGKLTATFFWPGTDAGVNGRWPTYFRRYDWRVQHEEKVAQVEAWLNLEPWARPGLIVVYFSDIDSVGHRTGPLSAETREAALKVDASVGRIAKLVRDRQVNMLLVADHGQSAVEGKFDLSAEADYTGCKAANEAPMTMLYCDDAERVYTELKKKESGWRVYRRDETPAHLHYRRNPRIGDLVILPDRPMLVEVILRTDTGTKPLPDLKGMHGYDPESNPEMDGLLIGTGPAFKWGARVKSARNVDVAPLVLHLMGLKAPEGLDGRLSRVSGLLR